ncbi:ribosome small subunit-dependent GTPase A [Bacteriovorax sp. BSW11_IV]|uniref:ribosome small subunit-dependent GTPase A n=1 Tax=Bacteriovorax sp. BSW11_IV TaxID=1353529 RepID=UPI00038A0CFE|nr:ribosome small subunit-dependent GTPase A [Bacteriovorax sp. BSW11_IV]EQC48717.1 ribosome small subunit-dependent GTPase A [Bacteriovorax sp. BSW11_IV]
MNSNFLEKAGLRSCYKNQLKEGEKPSDIARICHVHRDCYIGINSLGEEVSLKLVGAALSAALENDFLPVVGDFVVTLENPLASFSSIVRILERENEIARHAAGKKQTLVSNIDGGLICTSLNQNFKVNRLQRFISLLRSSGVEPVVVLTKLDLYEGEIAIEDFVEELKCELKIDKVICLSFETGENLNQLRSLLSAGESYVLIGSSGVGKSTLTNFILGSDIQKTQAIRDSDGKGVHTTVSRSLHIHESGVIVDTPGMRGLMLVASSDELDESFSDVSELIAKCRFTNCTHQNEPGCMILGSLESGDLDSDRYANYLRMRKEALYLQRRSDQGAYSEQRNKWKKLSVQYRKGKKVNV